jgi:nucleoid-associated protein YgaU
MNQKIVLVIAVIIGLGVGLVAGVMIANSRSKVVIADLQSKMQQSEATLQKRTSDYAVTINRLSNELRQSKIEIERLRASASEAAEKVAVASADNRKPVAASEGSSVPGDTKLYTVKDGDSLWEIAANQLGDGNRYKEILKLNPDVSADGRNLAIGTKLKIPAR